MSRRRNEENTLDARARLGHNVDQRNSDILGATTESARVGRSAGVFTAAMAITGLVWGLTLAIWATSPGADGTRAGMPVQGWFGCLLRPVTKNPSSQDEQSQFTRYPPARGNIDLCMLMTR